MEWLSWLEKGKKVQLTIAGWNEEAIHQKAPKKKVKFREDDDKGGAWEDSGYAKNASWESWLDKNNGIETDHKKDKKEEWDGKFDNATTRDDVKDDEDEDDKAVSEEESLEKLTDGKLEEIEKLKSWESWLDKALSSDAGALNVAAGTKGKKENMHGLGAGERHQRGEPTIRGHGVGTPEQVTVGGNVTTQPREVAVKPSGNDKTSQQNNRSMSKVLNQVTPKDIDASFKRVTENNTNELGTTTDKPVKTAEQLDAEFNERVQPEKRSKPMSKKQLAARARKKSWEAWLEKNSLDGEQSQDGLPKLTAGGKKIRLEAEETIERDTRGQKNQMYKSWLEKMQGAGDARFGNQHLTGLDQKPVDDEESEANILPESDENNEKQEEKEEKEGKDNKPYKALSQE
tara:strand:- start:1845 stop:3047 length:1203 start_codon:yes stop_codon:yes gene_type:complete